MVDNLANNESNKYLDFIKIKIKNEYFFTITIEKDLTTYHLYIIIFSYLKNKNLVIKSVNAIKYRVLGVEYINLINIINFSYYEFIFFKNQFMVEESSYYDSNFLFDIGTNSQHPLQIEISTFNKNNITMYTKPKNIDI